jgi:stage IV sporulation protein FB
MIQGMIEETPYDVKWRMFGTQVRVHPLFWVMAAVISWGLLDLGLLFLVAGILAIFVSILLHEFGHIWMGKWFGSDGHIVLWAFGGLAFGASHLDNRWKRIAVSAAGPGIQLLLWGALTLGLPYLPRPMDPQSFILLTVFLNFLLAINLYWAILNLLPIYPLDGGQISRDVFTHFSEPNGVRLSLQLSIGVAGLLALLGVFAQATGREYPVHWLPHTYRQAIFFAIFAFIGIQFLRAEMARDRWFEDRWQ